MTKPYRCEISIERPEKALTEPQRFAYELLMDLDEGQYQRLIKYLEKMGKEAE